MTLYLRSRTSLFFWVIFEHHYMDLWQWILSILSQLVFLLPFLEVCDLEEGFLACEITFDERLERWVFDWIHVFWNRLRKNSRYSGGNLFLNLHLWSHCIPIQTVQGRSKWNSSRWLDHRPLVWWWKRHRHRFWFLYDYLVLLVFFPVWMTFVFFNDLTYLLSSLLLCFDNLLFFFTLLDFILLHPILHFCNRLFLSLFYSKFAFFARRGLSFKCIFFLLVKESLFFSVQPSEVMLCFCFRKVRRTFWSPINFTWWWTIVSTWYLPCWVSSTCECSRIGLRTFHKLCYTTASSDSRLR